MKNRVLNNQKLLRKWFLFSSKCFRFCLKCTKMVVGWGSAPDPAGELTVFPRPPSCVGLGLRFLDFCTLVTNPGYMPENISNSSISIWLIWEDCPFQMFIGMLMLVLLSDDTNLILNNNLKKLKMDTMVQKLWKVLCFCNRIWWFEIWKIKICIKGLSVLKWHDFQYENLKKF